MFSTTKDQLLMKIPLKLSFNNEDWQGERWKVVPWSKCHKIKRMPKISQKMCAFLLHVLAKHAFLQAVTTQYACHLDFSCVALSLKK